MKNVKRFLSTLLALSMVLSMGSFALANDGEGGVEQVLLNETFEDVSGVDFPYTLPATATGAFNWTRNKDTATAQEYIFENDGTNTYMSFYNPKNTSQRREAKRTLNSAIPSGSALSVKLKFKYDSGVKAFHGFEILGKIFNFRTQMQGFYVKDSSGNTAQYWSTSYAAIYPNVWNDIEIWLFPATETESAKFQYYLGETLIVEDDLQNDLDYTGSNASYFVLGQGTGNAPTMGSSKIYYDDITVTAFDNKRVCEIASDKISLPSTATENITLPTEGFGGTAISWSSSNTSLIANDGTVTRPESGEIQNVTLTAAITYGTTSVTFPYTVKVLPANMYFYEDFESEPLSEDFSIAPGGTYNGWTRSNTISGYNDDSIYKVKSAAGTDSRVLNLSKTVDANSASSFYSLSKTMSEVDETYPVSVKLRLKRDDGINGAWVSINGLNYYLRLTNSLIYPSSYSNDNDYIAATVSPNVWHDIEFLVDYQENKYEFYLDGNVISAGKNPANRTKTFASVTPNNTFSIYINRNAEFAKEQNVYVDDIVVSKADVINAVDAEIASEFAGVKSSNITLPETSVMGATIDWATDNAEVVTNTGVITRPAAGSGNATANLTATVTYGNAVKEFTYPVTVLESGIWFFEDFEGAPLGTLTDYNNWSKSNSGTTSTPVESHDWTIANDGTKVAKLYRTTDSTDINNFTGRQITHTFDSITDKYVTIKSKVKISSLSNFFQIGFGNSTNMKTLTFRPRFNNFLEGGGHPGGTVTAFLPVDASEFDLTVWHDIEIKVNMVAKTYDLIFDNVTAVSNKNFNSEYDNTSLSLIRLGMDRKNWGEKDEYVAFDDVSVSVADSPTGYVIEGFTFADSEGAPCTYPEAGGAVTGISLKSFTNEDNKGIVAVFDGLKFIDVATFDAKDAQSTVTTIALTDLDIPADAADIRIKAFIWDGFTNLRPVISSVDYLKDKIKIFVSGDSIAESVAASSTRGGWGDYIGEHFDSENVEIVNTSVGGMTATEALTNSARFQRVLMEGSYGDYVLIGYAHNDQGKNHTISQYKESLAAMVNKARAKGITPVFVTSIARRGAVASDGSQDGQGSQMAGGYLIDFVNAMKSVGELYNVAVLDLNDEFAKYYITLGAEGLDAFYDSANNDSTHPSKAGAQWIAETISNLMKASTHSSLVVKEFIK